MNLSEQIEYINNIHYRIIEQQEFGFVTNAQLKYLVYDAKTCNARIRFEQKTDNMWLSIYDPDKHEPFMTCSLEDFLSNYFGDMINPAPEEKVMWKLQFGFDWYF